MWLKGGGDCQRVEMIIITSAGIRRGHRGHHIDRSKAGVKTLQD